MDIYGIKNKDLKIPFSDPLRPEDTETQTYGCRQNNPDICSSNGIHGICAFACDDCICRKPSRLWKKQFNKLKEDGEYNEIPQSKEDRKKV